MTYEFSGVVSNIFDIVQVSATFRKREFVVTLETVVGDKTFVDHVKFELKQDRVELLNSNSSIGIGDSVKVSFNIKGNRWVKEDRVSYFTVLEAWKIEKLGSSAAPSASASGEEIEDDLPF